MCFGCCEFIKFLVLGFVHSTSETSAGRNKGSREVKGFFFSRKGLLNSKEWRSSSAMGLQNIFYSCGNNNNRSWEQKCVVELEVCMDLLYSICIHLYPFNFWCGIKGCVVELEVRIKGWLPYMCKIALQTMGCIIFVMYQICIRTSWVMPMRFCFSLNFLIWRFMFSSVEIFGYYFRQQLWRINKILW